MKKTTTEEDTTRYNVFCRDCDRCWTPALKSPLWWQAKKRADNGFLDALCVSGEKCGCVQKQRIPDAPFRVFGSDLDSHFDIPFATFVGAVKEFLSLKRSRGYDVYIKGVSLKVESQLEEYAS